MTTNFTSLPVIDLAPLRSGSEGEPPPSPRGLASIAAQLCDVFETVGFAYLVNCPLSFSHDDVFGIAREFFDMPPEDKMSIAKRTFRASNRNTYRGYFPAQEGAADNLKEGFEMGPPGAVSSPSSSADNTAVEDRNNSKKASSSPFVLTEGNVFPNTSASSSSFGSRDKLEKLWTELQALSTTLLRLLATAVGKPEGLVDYLLEDSVSTLRLLHYPPPPPPSPAAVRQQQEEEGQEEEEEEEEEGPLCCTPHTDSGLLTLLHQDATGGLEVLNAAGEWVAAPYVPGSVVVNIGDLMAEMSGRRFVATMHRVRSSSSSSSGGGGGVGRKGSRCSVPFFFEPGVDALVKTGREGEGEGVPYGDFVLGKMRTWVEFQDVEGDREEEESAGAAGLSLAPEVDVGA